jgi:hypothetical protein
MSRLTILLITWGALTTVLVLLLIYRSTLTMHEDDQLFLDEAESHMRAEQEENNKKINRVTPLVRLFGAASGLLILVIAGMWVYTGLTQVQ